MLGRHGNTMTSHGKPPMEKEVSPRKTTSALVEIRTDEAVGQRIAKAREFLGLTQATVADRLGLARTTQVAIEQGRRPVSVAELYQYAETLSRPLDYFLGLGMWQEDADFRPQFRLMMEKLEALPAAAPRRPGRPKASTEASVERLALMRFEALCRNYLELEKVNRLPRVAMPELPSPRRLSLQEAEQLAATLRAHLDVGNDAPIRDLRVRLEDAFGLRVFVSGQMGRLLAGGFHHPEIGGCLLMAERPVPRMRFTLAHAVGQLLANRQEAVIEVGSSSRKNPVDVFASGFALALLLPARGLRERFGAVRTEASEVNEVALLYLARTFGVTLAALCARLESLRLVSTSSLKRIEETIRKVGPAEKDLTPQALPDHPKWEPFPERFVFLALRAYRKELINRARLAECLMTDENDSALRLLLYMASVADRHPGGAEPSS
jgi:transcriptional regulator with XRE-family HTH domain/Zn-dependent peptidase ImmA (M78 family)